MKTNNRLCLSFLIGFLVLPIVPTSLVLAGEEQRAPPEARTAGTLGPAVMRAISEIQELMQPEDPDDEPDLEWLRKQFRSSMRNQQIYLIVHRSGLLVGSSFSHELLTDRVLKSLAFNICLDINSRIKRYED